MLMLHQNTLAMARFFSRLTVLIGFCGFGLQHTFWNLKVNYAEIAGDRPGQPAYNF